MKSKRFYLGLAPTIHDPAIAIIDADGKVCFAEALERPLQEKRAWNHPPDAMGHIKAIIEEYCGTNPELVVAMSWSRSLVNRLRATAILELPFFAPWLGRFAQYRFSRRDHQVWPLNGYWPLMRCLRTSLTQAGVNLEWRGLVPVNNRIRGYNHHLTHAVTAAAASNFDQALCAVVDGFGEGTSTGFFHYTNGRVERLRTGQRRGRASLGTFYAMLCRMCGFDPIAGEEWKVMGLSPYGVQDQELYDLMRPMLKVDGLVLRQGISRKDYWSRIQKLEAQIRPSGSSPKEAANLARTGHDIFCEVMRELLGNLHATGLSDNLMLAGGCALNSAWNGRIISETPFTGLSVPSAPGDDGCAIGAAQLARLEDQPGSSLPRQACGFALGSRPQKATLQRLLKHGLPAGIQVREDDVPKQVAELVAGGKIVGWMQGAAEFGPRALGQRSIIADPRGSDIKDRLNREVKMRESFRPFAPAILDEYGDEWFESYTSAPHMERTFVFRQEVRSKVPGVVHVDGTGRAQSIQKEISPKYHAMVSEFNRLTGIPLILNTSLNRMGKPIVHAVEDALGLLLTTGLDALAIEDILLRKDQIS